MPESASKPTASLGAIDRFALSRPDFALIAPMGLYLVCLAARDALPYDFRWIAALLRGAVGLWAIWAFRRAFPAWGKAHVLLSIPLAALVAAGWFYGQYLFNWLGVPHGLPVMTPADFEFAETFPDPRGELAAGGFWVGLLGLNTVFWLDVVTRIGVASITVPLIEGAVLARVLVAGADRLGRFRARPAWQVHAVLVRRHGAALVHRAPVELGHQHPVLVRVQRPDVLEEECAVPRVRPRVHQPVPVRLGRVPRGFGRG